MATQTYTFILLCMSLFYCHSSTHETVYTLITINNQMSPESLIPKFQIDRLLNQGIVVIYILL